MPARPIVQPVRVYPPRQRSRPSVEPVAVEPPVGATTGEDHDITDHDHDPTPRESEYVDGDYEINELIDHIRSMKASITACHNRLVSELDDLKEKIRQLARRSLRRV